MIKKYKVPLIISSIAIIIPVILVLLLSLFKKDVNTVIVDDNSEKPEINISSKDADAINKYIDKLYNQYMKNEENKFNYTVYSYKNITSLLIIIDEYNENIDEYVRKYYSYNIDKKTGDFLDIEAICEEFGYDLVDIVEVVNNRLQKYYNEENIQGYLDGECDFVCYKSFIRGMDDITNNLNLVIEDDKLVIYLNLNIDDMSSDYDYFDSLDYDPTKIVME